MELTNEEDKKIKLLKSELADAFIWSESPQGEAYWDRVYANLELILGHKKNKTKVCKECGHEVE